MWGQVLRKSSGASLEGCLEGARLKARSQGGDEGCAKPRGGWWADRPERLLGSAGSREGGLEEPGLWLSPPCTEEEPGTQRGWEASGSQQKVLGPKPHPLAFFHEGPTLPPLPPPEEGQGARRQGHGQGKPSPPCAPRRVTKTRVITTWWWTR